MNTIKLISIFYEVPYLKNNNLFNEAIVTNYRWLKWAPFINNELNKLNIEVVTSDIAIIKIQKNEISPSEVGVVQFMDDKDSLLLLKKGCIPLLLLTFESPVYATNFFSNPKKYLCPYRAVHVFSGLVKYLSDYKGDINILNGYGFYEVDEILEPIKWKDRDFMVFVTSNIYPLSVSNKYLKHYSTVHIYFKRLFKLIISLKLKQIIETKSISLSNLRYDSIIFFGEQNLLRIYGRGWENLNLLPYEYKFKLSKIYNQINPQVCINKITTISKYKFTLCFENARFDGYISEKIIECFVAGTIPIYYGAYDINQFIPKNCFIDYNDFKNLNELNSYLINLNVTEAENYINNARIFLTSENGLKYSFEYFQKTIYNSLKNVLKK